MPATIKDIASKTGLGLATISKYLNGGNVLRENKIAIKEAIKGSDFRVNTIARGLKTSKSMSVGIVIPELSNTFITTIISVLEDELRKKGYSTIVCDCRTNEQLEKEAVEFVLPKMVDGIINMPVLNNGSYLTSALENNIPVVFIDRTIEGIKADSILTTMLLRPKEL